jgi:hypothetical protein
MSISPYDAWVLARLLAGETLDGELANVSESWRPLTEALNNLEADARNPCFQWAILRERDRDGLIKAVGDVGSDDPPPELGTKRRTAHLGDLAGFQSAGRFIWPNWLVRGHFNLFSSDPKVGKTHLALYLAWLIYSAEPWPDGQPATFPEGTRTLWVCGDRHQDELRERAAAFGLPPEAILLNASPDDPYGGWDLDNPDNVAALRERVEAERPGLTIIDTVWRATRRRLNREDEVNLLMNPLITMAQECGAAILGLMHLSKDNETLGRRLEGLARAILKLFKPDPGKPDRRKLIVTGNFKEPPPLGVTLRDGGCDFDFAPPEEPARSPGGRPPVKLDKAVAFLETELADGDRKGCELIDKWLGLGEHKSPIFDARRHLQAEGRLVVDDSRKPQIWHLVKPDSESETSAP